MVNREFLDNQVKDLNSISTKKYSINKDGSGVRLVQDMEKGGESNISNRMSVNELSDLLDFLKIYNQAEQKERQKIDLKLTAESLRQSVESADWEGVESCTEQLEALTNDSIKYHNKVWRCHNKECSKTFTSFGDAAKHSSDMGKGHPVDINPKEANV